MEKDKKKKLIIFGSEGTAIEMKEFISNTLDFDSVEIVFITENLGDKDELAACIDSNEYNLYFLLGTIDHKWRTICLDRLHGKPIEAFTYIHPKAFVAGSANIGKGVYVGPNASISSLAIIGDHSLVNLNASVGHHAVLGKHVSVLPGARISGGVRIGDGALIGSNSFIYQGLEVGENAAIDALAYVKKNIPPNTITFGPKSKTIRKVV